MKKIIFLITINLISLSLFSQNFPGNNPELLIGKIVKPKKIKENYQKYSYNNFFIEFDKEKKQFTKSFSKNKPFPSGSSYSLVSDYNKLVGKEFKVIGVFEIKSEYSSNVEEYAIEIENSEIGIIFYNYNPKYESKYELEVVGDLDYPENFFCSKIKYQNEIFFTPNENGINFIKKNEKSKSNIYLSARVKGDKLNTIGKKLDIIFENGEKLTYSNIKIQTKKGFLGGYIYIAFIQLNPSEIKLILENNMTDIKIDTYNSRMNINSAKKNRAVLKCLLK